MCSRSDSNNRVGSTEWVHGVCRLRGIKLDQATGEMKVVFVVVPNSKERGKDTNVIHTSIVLLSLVACAVVTPVSALAQQTTGVPGAPNATTAVDGRYLPTPPAPFGGVISQDAKLTPWSHDLLKRWEVLTPTQEGTSR
jgi:hypothetical protein